MTYFIFLLKKLQKSLKSSWVLHYRCNFVFNCMFLLYVFYFVCKFPPLPGSCIIHYRCSHIFYFMFLLYSHLHPDFESQITTVFIVICFAFSLTLNSHLHPALESYISTVVINFALYFYFNPASAPLLSHALPLYL